MERSLEGDVRNSVLLAALLLTASVAAVADSPLTVTVGFSNQGPGAQDFIENPILKAMPEFYARAGVTIDAEPVSIATLVPLVQDDNPGVAEGTGLGTVAVVGAKGPRRDVRIFIGELQSSPFELVVRQGVTTLAQVKNVGVASMDSASAQICQAILNNAHFQEDRDYHLTIVGLTGKRIEAVQSASVDGTCEAMPYPEQYGEKYGLKVLASLASPGGRLLPFVAGAWVYNTQWGRDPQHREALVRIAEAYLLALRWTYDPANKDKVVGMIEQSFSVSPDVASAFYERLITQHMLSPDGYLPKAALEGVARVMAGTGTLKTTAGEMSRYFDWSILQTASKRLGLAMRTPEY
jgi:ABC-type nitrate/sulfonate/bicarbonate transport system substrate-binding protein